MRHLLTAATAAACVLTLAAPAQAADPQLTAAVKGPHRAAAHVARDEARRPAETLSFWGVKPGQTIVEISPGSGYWTEILAPYAKATGGRYVATAADLDNPKTSENARKGRADFEAKFADTSKYGQITYVGFGGGKTSLGAPGTADIVITARNIHNWMTVPGLLDQTRADVHAVLKPGGVLAVEEHRAAPRPQAPNVSDGYVATASVVAAAEKAGFKLAASSEVNANPKDTKDHPFGVWTLPPTRRNAPYGQADNNPTFDRSKYDAIGESDRMTLQFVKAG